MSRITIIIARQNDHNHKTLSRRRGTIASTRDNSKNSSIDNNLKNKKENIQVSSTTAKTKSKSVELSEDTSTLSRRVKTSAATRDGSVPTRRRDNLIDKTEYNPQQDLIKYFTAVVSPNNETHYTVKTTKSGKIIITSNLDDVGLASQQEITHININKAFDHIKHFEVMKSKLNENIQVLISRNVTKNITITFKNKSHSFKIHDALTKNINQVIDENKISISVNIGNVINNIDTVSAQVVQYLDEQAENKSFTKDDLDVYPLYISLVTSKKEITSSMIESNLDIIKDLQLINIDAIMRKDDVKNKDIDVSTFIHTNVAFNVNNPQVASLIQSPMSNNMLKPYINALIYNKIYDNINNLPLTDFINDIFPSLLMSFDNTITHKEIVNILMSVFKKLSLSQNTTILVPIKTTQPNSKEYVYILFTFAPKDKSTIKSYSVNKMINIIKKYNEFKINPTDVKITFSDDVSLEDQEVLLYLFNSQLRDGGNKGLYSNVLRDVIRSSSFDETTSNPDMEK